MVVRVTILSRYSRLGASSRLRTMQYLPALKAAGLEVTVASFFDDAYLQQLYVGKRVLGDMVRYYQGRLAQCRAAQQADVIWVEKEALPWLPWALERLALPRGVPVVSDYDDAVFHRYDMSRRPLVRAVLGRKIDGVMKHSALVTAGNAYLADRARAAGARRVEIVPTVVDAQAYRPGLAAHADGRPRIGWIGTPQTWSKYGVPRTAFFQDFALRHGAMFRLVGARMEAAVENAFEYLPWAEASEVACIQSMDIGIMPLMDDPWERGKCGYKLIQYMACGLPVIASPVGVNTEIIEHGVNGFLAETDEDWRTALEALVCDPALRERMGRAGREKVGNCYSLQVQGPRIADLLTDIAKAGQA